MLEYSASELGINLTLSPFRTLRLMRVFKLIKGNVQLSLLVETIIRTVYNLTTFAMLLLLMVFVFTLIGMQLFAGKIKLNLDGSFLLDKYG
jgi:hypothetical protein